MTKELFCPFCQCPRSFHRDGGCVMADAGGGNCGCTFFNEPGRRDLKILVCGDREWWDVDLIDRILRVYPKSTWLIHGAARGADSIAGRVGHTHGLRVLPMPADWEHYGRAAGPIRNREMIKLEPDFVIAFHDNIMASRGTKDMVKVAIDENIAHAVVSH